MVLRPVEDPGRRSPLAEHPEHVPEFVEEALRYDSPLRLIGRVASADCLPEGAEIRAGEMVYLMVGAAYYDPVRFTDLAQFTDLDSFARVRTPGGVQATPQFGRCTGMNPQ
ncbi:hypothetical protein [Streptomyces sp. NPDC050528]|uniref:hypothetical protein n=1 Tax=unclassified Streptomyces TaxID=2593676 RepID=UPI0037A1084C